MKPIKEILPDVIQDIETKKKKGIKDRPEELFKKIFSKKELKHIGFNYFRDGILGIKVDSSAWLYQLSLQKPNLLSKLQKNSPATRDIHFRLGEMDKKR